VAIKKCNHCNTVNPSLNQFCAECGSSLELELSPASNSNTVPQIAAIKSSQTQTHNPPEMVKNAPYWVGVGLTLLLLVVVVIVLSGLNLLGSVLGSPTATRVPYAVAVTTVPAIVVGTTAPVKTAYAVAATTVPAIVVGTTAASTTIPIISGATEVTLDAAFSTELAKQIPGLNNPIIKLYVSNDDAQKLADNADLAFTGAGYKFGLPGMTKPTFYVKTGSVDILLETGTVPADAGDFSKALNIPNMTTEETKKLTDQIKGKKSMLIIIAAPDLLESMMAAASSSTAVPKP